MQTCKSNHTIIKQKQYGQIYQKKKRYTKMFLAEINE